MQKVDKTVSEEIEQNEAAEELRPLTFGEMLHSTFAAAIGVQNSANRKRDFSRGNWVHFVYMGIGFTAFFVLLMLTIVQTVLSSQ